MQYDLFGELPAPPPRSSDTAARAEMMETIEALAGAETHPWSARLLGWKVRTFNVLAQKLTPLDAAALTARLDAELERLGPAED
ncbi:MAG: hypothetical protein KF780_09075 [Sphingomonas sp.]|nr:hypothetical protein [Sphingomonas sp.]